MFNLGPMELTILLVILLVLFGGKKLPELAKGLGQGIREFKKSSTTDESDEPVKSVEKKDPA